MLYPLSFLLVPSAPQGIPPVQMESCTTVQGSCPNIHASKYCWAPLSGVSLPCCWELSQSYSPLTCVYFKCQHISILSIDTHPYFKLTFRLASMVLFETRSTLRDHSFLYTYILVMIANCYQLLRSILRIGLFFPNLSYLELFGGKTVLLSTKWKYRCSSKNRFWVILLATGV